MNDQMENNVVLEGAELQKTKLQMMHYRGNGLSYKLGFLGIAFSVLGAFVCLNSFHPDFLGFLKILLNIAILLFGFLCCEKVKSYSKEASIAMCVIGGVCVLRIFWVPMNLMIWYNKFVSATATTSSETATEAEKEKAREVLSKAKNYLGDIVTTTKSTINWLPKDGNFRGVLAIVFLACAAAAFIASGVIGFIQSQKYIASKNEKIGG